MKNKSIINSNMAILLWFIIILVTSTNGLLITAEGQSNDDYRKGSAFRLCGKTDLCSPNSNCSHTSELCVVEDGFESKIIYDTIHE